MAANSRCGFHSGTLHCRDAKVLRDLYVQDDIIFSDVSAGTLGITGGIDMQSTTSAIGIDLGGTFSTSAINIDGSNVARAIQIGTKTTGMPITTSGLPIDTDPNNYMLGLFSVVSSTAATSSDELRGAWIRTRVNADMDIGSNAGWGYGVCGAEVQLKFYGGTTKVYAWQNSALWAQLESQDATTTFYTGSYSQCVLANIGLTTATINSGAVVAGVTINANSSSITNNGAYYGLFITDKNTTSTDFTSGIWITDSVATTGITLGNCTTGILLDGTYTTGISMVGGVSYNPIHIGVKGNDPDLGLILTGATDDTGGIMIFCDDGNDTLGSVTSPIWARYLITKNQGTGGPTATGMFSQIKSLTGLTFATGSYTAFKAYNQVGGTLVLNGAATEVGIINAGITYEGDVTVTNGTLSGIDINVDDNAYTIGTSSGLLVRKVAASTLGWTYGINIADAGAVTGINIGTCTTGINITGSTKGMSVISTLTGTANLDANTITITDNSTAGAYCRGLAIGITAAGAKTGSGEVDGLGIDMTYTGNTVYGYNLSLYSAASGNPTLGFVSPISIYQDNLGNALGAYVGIDIGIALSNAPSDRYSYMRFRDHSTAIPKSLFRCEGAHCASYLIDTTGGTGTPDFITTNNGTTPAADGVLIAINYHGTPYYIKASSAWT